MSAYSEGCAAGIHSHGNGSDVGHGTLEVCLAPAGYLDKACDLGP